jgi:large subunit ribosomal protein L2
MKLYKPTSAGIRQRAIVEYKKLLSGETAPKKSLTIKLQDRAGRNNRGTITTRHQGGGVKKVYRVVDFMMNKMNVPGRITTIEYDPYRSAFISLVVYKDGDQRYIVTPQNVKVGEEIITAPSAPIKVGNRLQLKNIPIGYQVFGVEVRPYGGATLARSAGSYVEVLGSDAGMTDLRLASKEVRRVPSDCFATIGAVSNPDYTLINLGKAGRSRWLGIRPTVRGSAMNPVDHPYGGGEGAQPRGTRKPKTAWGKVTGGRKTRMPKKWSNKLILERRPKVR